MKPLRRWSMPRMRPGSSSHFPGPGFSSIKAPRLETLLHTGLKRARLRIRFSNSVAVMLTLLLLLSSLPSTGDRGAVNWITDNANSDGTNSVPQFELNTQNVGSIKQTWSFPFPSAQLVPGLNITGQGSIAPPLIVNGRIYLVMNDLDVIAIDAVSGSTIWNFLPTINRTDLPLGTLAGHVHGFAYHDGLI